MNEYVVEVLRLVERNRLSESENHQTTKYLSGLK